MKARSFPEKQLAAKLSLNRDKPAAYSCLIDAKYPGCAAKISASPNCEYISKVVPVHLKPALLQIQSAKLPSEWPQRICYRQSDDGTIGIMKSGDVMKRLSALQSIRREKQQ
jgi:hypothetical protein